MNILNINDEILFEYIGKEGVRTGNKILYINIKNSPIIIGLIVDEEYNLIDTEIRTTYESHRGEFQNLPKKLTLLINKT